MRTLKTKYYHYKGHTFRIKAYENSILMQLNKLPNDKDGELFARFKKLSNINSYTPFQIDKEYSSFSSIDVFNNLKNSIDSDLFADNQELNLMADEILENLKFKLLTSKDNIYIVSQQ